MEIGVDLREEYFLRHKIKSPIIKYNTTGNLLLKFPAKSIDVKWRIMSINVFNKEGDAGRFDMRFYLPIHNNNSILKLCVFDEIKDQFFWEDYEEKLVNRCKSFHLQKVIPITDSKELELACWEILLYSHDSWVAELPVFIQDKLHRVLFNGHEELSEALSILQNIENKMLIKGWNSIKQYVDPKTYATWIAHLIGGDRND
jgi:hypothetical protein